MSRLERVGGLARNSAKILDTASVVSITATTLVAGMEITRKNPKKAAMVGAVGAVVTAGLRVSGVLFHECADQLGIQAEKDSDRPF